MFVFYVSQLTLWLDRQFDATCVCVEGRKKKSFGIKQTTSQSQRASYDAKAKRRQGHPSTFERASFYLDIHCDRSEALWGEANFDSQGNEIECDSNNEGFETPAMQVGFWSQAPMAPEQVFESISAEDEQANFVAELIKETTISNKVATICGLVNQPEHNGTEVEVVAFDDERGRFNVKLPTGENVFVKERNLKVGRTLDALPGSSMGDLFSATRSLPTSWALKPWKTRCWGCWKLCANSSTK